MKKTADYSHNTCIKKVSIISNEDNTHVNIAKNLKLRFLIWFNFCCYVLTAIFAAINILLSSNS